MGVGSHMTKNQPPACAFPSEGNARLGCHQAPANSIYMTALAVKRETRAGARKPLGHHLYLVLGIVLTLDGPDRACEHVVLEINAWIRDVPMSCLECHVSVFLNSFNKLLYQATN